MSFPSVEYFLENSGCPAQKILLENVIICVCIGTNFTNISSSESHCTWSGIGPSETHENILDLDSHYIHVTVM